jgi:hypothetical protein
LAQASTPELAPASTAARVSELPETSQNLKQKNRDETVRGGTGQETAEIKAAPSQAKQRKTSQASGDKPARSNLTAKTAPHETSSSMPAARDRQVKISPKNLKQKRLSKSPVPVLQTKAASMPKSIIFNSCLCLVLGSHEPYWYQRNMETNSVKRAALYVRVSTRDKGQDTENQLVQLRRATRLQPGQH